MDIDVQDMNIDILCFTGHKALLGPQGTGGLYVRKGVKIETLLHGGAQERGFRAGTENVPAIVGLGKAVELEMRLLDRGRAFEDSFVDIEKIVNMEITIED